MSTIVYADIEINNDDGTTVETEETIKVYTLSLDDAIKMALTDNPQLNACLEKKEDTKIQLKSARETKADYRDLKNIPISSATPYLYPHPAVL